MYDVKKVELTIFKGTVSIRLSPNPFLSSHIQVTADSPKLGHFLWKKKRASPV